MITVVEEVQKLGSSLGIWTASQNFLDELIYVRRNVQQKFRDLHPIETKDERLADIEAMDDGSLGGDIQSHSAMLARLSTRAHEFSKHVDDFSHLGFREGYGQFTQFAISMNVCGNMMSSRAHETSFFALVTVKKSGRERER